MIRKKKNLIFLFCILFSLITILLLINTTAYNDDNRVLKISIITRGKTSESWMIIKQGIDQAALEMNAEISFITLAEENSITEQKELLEREYRNGADAIIISPADFEEMKEPIEDLLNKVPIVLMDSTISSKRRIANVACDNYELGSKLADEMIKMGNTRANVAILSDNFRCSSLSRRYQGFTDSVKESKNTFSIYEISKDEQVAYEDIKRLIQSNKYDVLVALDSKGLEMAGQVKKDMLLNAEIDKYIEIYGIGSTSKVISFIEDEVIKAIAMQNDFNLGYLSVKAAVDEINGKKYNENSIDTTVINRWNMYSKENQRLLFPFVR